MHDKYWEFHLFFTKEEDEVILHLLYSCPWAVKQLLYSLSMHDKYLFFTFYFLLFGIFS